MTRISRGHAEGRPVLRERRRQRRRLDDLHAAAAAMTPGLRASRVRLVVPRRNRKDAALVAVRPSLIPGRYVINYPLSLLKHEPDDVVIGTLGHEYQHILGRDSKVRQRAGDLARQAGALALLGVFGAAVSSLAFLLLPDLAATVVTVALLAVGVWLFLRWVARFVAGLDRPEDLARNRHAELRCDLAAVRAVGRGPVEAMLRHGGLLDDQSHLPLAERTHPPIEMRIAAVRAYDLILDPAEVAAEVLRHGRPRPDFTSLGRRASSAVEAGEEPQASRVTWGSGQK